MHMHKKINTLVRITSYLHGSWDHKILRGRSNDDDSDSQDILSERVNMKEFLIMWRDLRVCFYCDSVTCECIFIQMIMEFSFNSYCFLHFRISLFMTRGFFYCMNALFLFSLDLRKNFIKKSLSLKPVSNFTCVKKRKKSNSKKNKIK
jgi:hypothetical protein